MKVVFGIVVVLLLIPTFGFSQSEEARETQRPLTIEELFLSQDIEIQIIRSQALAEDRDSKLLSLQAIRGMINSGRTSAEDASVLAVLDSLAGEGVYRVVRQGGSVVNNYPEVRRQSANLLGEIGGEGSKTILLKMMADDPEPMVLSEAVLALGQIWINDPEVTARIVAVLRRNNYQVSPDNNLAYSTLLALEKLAGAGDGIARPDILQVLIEVVSGNYIDIVKAKALDILSNLRN